MSKDEARGWGFGIAFGFLLAMILVWSWPPLEPNKEHQERTESSPYGVSTTHEVPKTFGEWWANVSEKTREDPIALYTLVLTVFTGFLGAATVALWVATRASEVNKRSIVRGGGWYHANRRIFEIRVCNSGAGTALIERIHWGFCEFHLLKSEPPIYDSAVTADPVAPHTPFQLAKAVQVPDHFFRPVIYFQFDYFDVSQKIRASKGCVMEISPPDIPVAPIHTDAPAAYLIDTFPVAEERALESDRRTAEGKEQPKDHNGEQY